ncbi:hypothetical protein LWI29_001339 [Acer saccharum]|uniref:KRR1 small subunit processome component second KH domain-containing protein n=1 Tax=Acer saccharum TaxID=4024 RepID=A0AA39W1Q2_ACESA|nr:hypothetical protein LWI29_001339 [Acer saccharum]
MKLAVRLQLPVINGCSVGYGGHVQWSEVAHGVGGTWACGRLEVQTGTWLEQFVKRRQHLVGPNSSTLRALEILTGCYILVQGNTVAAMGSFKGLKQVRKIVEDCIQNKMHPVYHIKILMIKKELEKDPALANENWDRFLPNFKKYDISCIFVLVYKYFQLLTASMLFYASDCASLKKMYVNFSGKMLNKRRSRVKRRNNITPFPPPPQPSKIDKLLESGEYFLSDKKKESKKWQEKQEKQAEKTADNKRKREAAFIPPEEPSKQDPREPDDHKKDVASMAKSLKEKAKMYGKQKSVENINPEVYIAASGEKSSKTKIKAFID